MNIVIFGGSFDPIHNGHLNMAQIASDTLDADVFFVPSKIAIWKECSINKNYKKEMVELSIKYNKRFKLCTYELDNPKNSVFSIETVTYFKNLYPNDNLYFLIGADQVNLFHKWNEAKKLSNLAQIIYFNRPGILLDKNNLIKYKMMEIKGEINDISSTNIRNFTEIDLNEDVLRFIENNDLYYIKDLKKWYGYRYIHVLNTAKLSYEIAKIHGFDSGKAYIAGFLHDLGKMVNIQDPSKDFSKEIYFLNNTFKDCKNLPKYAWHQVLGVYYAKNIYNITDEEILNSILYHCTGKDNMSWLDKIVYSADKIEPSREYDSSELINLIKKDFEKGFIEVLKSNKKFIDSKANGDENQLTLNCYNFYLR